MWLRLLVSTFKLFLHLVCVIYHGWLLVLDFGLVMHVWSFLLKLIYALYLNLTFSLGYIWVIISRIFRLCNYFQIFTKQQTLHYHHNMSYTFRTFSNLWERENGVGKLVFLMQYFNHNSRLAWNWLVRLGLVKKTC